ncbi:MAG: sporulation inhibitor of replication protein SirA [Priestia megaterium]|uniref:sporulation inhibitor of replication protein SirA n=1 Tax=Priestia megaterium TaxID=1404 RepID=UPI00068360CB|nr:sporulation inhibitor of replication protein SirA [Priestia megaterium]KRD89806.1 sporulation inhibitor of replication protein sirA [Bacillus sp. Root147]AUO10825.1 sporulation inhibitor of replication protein SirA [Priestia megaterium]KNH22586.1 sporulation inhibitor of replication protein sirA [Priestia megaterium]PVE72820.1 sporulation inhibitor of replication protein SirA [Priestia megaterium]PVE89609.1 sporulation inhibitor of replication protein SirA [Priestia megaterium]
MRTYEVYLMEEEVASSYFRREKLIYQLLIEYRMKRHLNETHLQKQVHYITRQLPISFIQRELLQAFSHYPHFFTHQETFVLEYPHKKSRASIKLTNRCITIEGDGNVDAETAFFEVLRKLDPCFLAVNYGTDEYGWLRPVKTRKFV